MGKQKKEITYYDKILTPENINSGLTCDEYIFIWRQEELIKVLFHEMIHYYNFDFKNEDVNILLNEIFNVNGSNSSCESYTETLAIIINSIFVENETNYDFNFIISTEQKFILFQISKILSFYEMNKFEDIIDGTKYINQKTNVLSYFFIKGILLLSLDDFFIFMNNNICFYHRYKQFKDLIKKSLKQFPYTFVNKTIPKINKIKNMFIKKTLRMSCFELQI